MTTRAAALAVLLVGIAAPAWAQPADPIGDLLTRPQATAQPDDADEEDRDGQPLAPPEPEPQIAPGAVVTPPPPAPRLTRPVTIEETGKSPEAPPSARDLAYDSRIRSSFAAAQAYRGQLDGSWTLSAGGADLYLLKLSEKANGPVEGAWLDLRRKGATGASGFIDQAERSGGGVTLRFGPGVVADLTSTAAGGWSGQLDEGGQRRAVTLRRAP